MAAVSQALGLASSGQLLAGAMAADNLATALYLTVIMAIPARDEAPAAPGQAAGPHGGSAKVTSASLALALAAAALACTLGAQLARLAGFGDAALAVVALLASGMAWAGGWAARRMGGGQRTLFAGAGAVSRGGCPARPTRRGRPPT